MDMPIYIYMCVYICIYIYVYSSSPDSVHSTLLSRQSMWKAVRYSEMASGCTTAVRGASTA